MDEYVLAYVSLLLLVGVLFQNYFHCSVSLQDQNSGCALRFFFFFFVFWMYIIQVLQVRKKISLMSLWSVNYVVVTVDARFIVR